MLDNASKPLKLINPHYRIQDAIEPAITVLPELLKRDKSEEKHIRQLLLQLVLIPWNNISIFAIRAVLHQLWSIDFSAAQSVLMGYIFLKPRYDEIRQRIRKANLKKGIYEVSEKEVMDFLVQENKKELKKITSVGLQPQEVSSLEKLDLETLKIVFDLIPIKTDDEYHKKILTHIFQNFAERFFQEREDKIDPHLRIGFQEKLAYFILNSKTEDIAIYLEPFLEKFDNSRGAADLFEAFTTMEDRLFRYEEFWFVWELFYEKVLEKSKDKTGFSFYSKGMLYKYLFTGPWKETAKEWHTVTEKEKSFFKKVSEGMGDHPAVLYSLAKLLKDIGSRFTDDGIGWISKMLQKNKNLETAELETNTIYYLELLVKQYVYKNRHKIRKSKNLKEELLVILDFLVKKGSVTGYLVREDIL